MPPAYEFIIQQHIQHGPIMYRNIRYLPSLFGMVAIQNNLIWSPEIKSLFAEIGISGVIVKSDYDFVTYRGDYFNYFELLIEKIQLANQSIGPIRLQVSTHKLNVQAIEEIINIYKEIAEHGEIYQGQFKKKIFAVLPAVIYPGSAISLNQFDLITPHGRIHMSGIVKWPEKKFVAFSQLLDMLQSADAKLVIQISKNLTDDVVFFLANIPGTIREISAPDRSMLLQARNQMAWAVKQNTLLIAKLVANQTISRETGDYLRMMQKSLISTKEYAAQLQALLTNKQILEKNISQLNTQYALLQKPYQFLESKVLEYQKIAEQKIKMQLNDLLERGYVLENKDDYSLSFNWADGKLTLNHHAVQ